MGNGRANSYAAKPAAAPFRRPGHEDVRHGPGTPKESLSTSVYALRRRVNRSPGTYERVSKTATCGSVLGNPSSHDPPQGLPCSSSRLAKPSFEDAIHASEYRQLGNQTHLARKQGNSWNLMRPSRLNFPRRRSSGASHVEQHPHRSHITPRFALHSALTTPS